MNRFRINKAFAEAVAGIIPNKMARNRWRGILRYGIFRALRLIRRLKKDKTLPQHYLAICAIVKNEAPYLQEWIEWHKNLGVEKFYIYDNESTDNTKKILASYIESGLVDYVYWKGGRQQLPVYDDCLEKHRLEANWIAVIDLDEFIVPMKDKTIPDFLKRFENFSAVEINWLVYGSSGAKEKEPGTIMERFRQHSLFENVLNRKIKTIVNPRRVFNFIGAHEASRICGRIADSHGNAITRNYHERQPQHDVIRLNHYATKSYDEFLKKRARGSARGDVKRLQLKYFNQFDLNDIKEQ